MASKAAPTDQTRTAPIGLRVTPRLKDELTALAKGEKRTLASYVELVLEAHVEQAKKQAGKKR
jgi:predicted DNA-binding protein